MPCILLLRCTRSSSTLAWLSEKRPWAYTQVVGGQAFVESAKACHERSGMTRLPQPGNLLSHLRKCTHRYPRRYPQSETSSQSHKPNNGGATSREPTTSTLEYTGGVQLCYSCSIGTAGGHRRFKSQTPCAYSSTSTVRRPQKKRLPCGMVAWWPHI
jgi:hypothetical protein